MRYSVEALQDENDDTGYYPAVIAAEGPSERLALRHARAMLAVQRAAKAYRRCHTRPGWETGNEDTWAAHNRIMDAVAILVKVEREVRRGSK